MEQIINGVDIKDCPFKDGELCKQTYYTEEFRKGDEMYILPCEDFANCLYRQLRRKEVECEELKKDNYQLNSKDINLSFALGKYIKALAETEKIAKENCSCPRCEEGNCCNGCEDENYKYILQIIQKVKGEL